VINVKLYIEGGGDSKEQHSRCREGFRKLLERSGFSGRMPRIIAGGGRNATFRSFAIAIRSGECKYPILLVDSEDVLSNSNTRAWEHLAERDNWERPQRVEDDQAQLMVTCMETWIIADRTALRTYFGAFIRESSLCSIIDLETRHRHEIQEALADATNNCKKIYRKGERSFEIVAQLNPEILKHHLPHFKSFVDALDRHL
jgi:hypothetical protein